MIQFRTPTDVQVDTTKLQALVSALPTNPMGGWFDLPEAYDRAELAAIQAAAAKIQQTSEYLVCIGIGGSSLRHRGLSDALPPPSCAGGPPPPSPPPPLSREAPRGDLPRRAA